jgi:hydroxyacylglutathione hydrolase
MGLLIECAKALSDNYIWILHDESSGQTAAVDPGQAAPVLDFLKHRGWHLDWIFNTHHHNDHTGANIALKEVTGCKIVGSEVDRHRIPSIDLTVTDGDQILLGDCIGKVLLTPGHTTGHLCFWFDKDKSLFCGDTLFSLGCGRLFEGDAATMLCSLNRIAELPGETRIFCAHEYTQVNGQFAFTVDPDNPALLARLAEVERLRLNGEPTVPQVLQIEIETNPFLRVTDAAIVDHLGLVGASPEVVFATLRAQKDSFRI